MVEFDCGDCGTPLASVTSTVAETDRELGPYPVTFVTCPQCGAAWAQDADGVLTKHRSSL